MGSEIDVLVDRVLIRWSVLKKVILVVEIALYFLASIGFLYFIFTGIKVKAIKCIIIVCLLLGYRFIQLFLNIKLHDFLKLSVLVFIFMAMFLAETLNFYSRIPTFDKILHSISGAMLFFLGQALFKRVVNNPKDLHNNTTLMIFFSLFFSIALAGCWEIFEFSLDRLFGYHLQKDSLFDTMGDIICGTSMAVFSGIFMWILFRVRKVNVAKKILDEEIQGECSETAIVKELKL